MGAIYRIYNTETGHSYIGQSDKPYHRISNHLTPGRSNGSTAIQAALLDCHHQSWQWEIVADNKNYPGVSLNALERLFIDLYDSQVHGYNIEPGGGQPPCGDTQDETEFRRGMRDKIEGAISAYRKENWQRIKRDPVDWLGLAEANLPDSKLNDFVKFCPEIPSLEYLKRKIEEAHALNKAYQQITDVLSSKVVSSARDAIVEELNSVSVTLPRDILSHIFIKISFRRKVDKTEDGKEVGSWSAVSRLLATWDYE